MIDPLPAEERALRPEKTSDAEIRRREVIECDPYRKNSSWEPSMTVHNVFSRHIPNAFGMSFFKRLIAASPRPVAAQTTANAGQ